MRLHGKTRLHQGDGWTQGNWDAIDLGGDRRIAHFSCPACGRPFTCMDVDVKEGGDVALHVGCPYSCPVNQGIRLIGW